MFEPFYWKENALMELFCERNVVNGQVVRDVLPVPQHTFFGFTVQMYCQQASCHV